jgi:hypothetical protein
MASASCLSSHNLHWLNSRLHMIRHERYPSPHRLPQPRPRIHPRPQHLLAVPRNQRLIPFPQRPHCYPIPPRRNLRQQLHCQQNRTLLRVRRQIRQISLTQHNRLDRAYLRKIRPPCLQLVVVLHNKKIWHGLAIAVFKYGNRLIQAPHSSIPLDLAKSTGCWRFFEKLQASQVNCIFERSFAPFNASGMMWSM